MGFIDTLRDKVFEKSDSIGTAKIALGALALVVAVAIAALLFGSPSGESELIVNVVNENGEGLWKSTVNISGSDIGLESITSQKTDRDGAAVFSGLKIGQEINVEASGKGFERQAKTITLSKSKEEISLTLKPLEENTQEQISLSFTGPNGAVLDSKVITAQLSCSSGLKIKDPIKQISNGRLEFTKPSGCEELSANVSASGFESASFTLEESQIIRLEEISEQNARAIISVKDPDGKFLDNIEVRVQDARSVPTGDVQRTSFGEVQFLLQEGQYSAILSDNTGKYSPQKVDFSTSTNAVAKVNAILSEKPIATIKVKVADKKSKAPIKNAAVALLRPDGVLETKEFVGIELLFPISKSGEYKLSASSDGFATADPIEINSAQILGQGYVLERSSCTLTTCGLVRIKVVDEDKEGVSNARVVLLDEKGFFAQNHGIKYTNTNGVAIFSNVKPGNYSALVQKYPSEARSAQFEAKQGLDTDITASLEIGEGEIEVEAQDLQGKAIAFGFANFRSEKEPLGKLPLDSKGKIIFKTKADKQIFVTIESDGFSNYTSTAIQILPNKVNKIKAVLQKHILSDSPKIEFVGLFDEYGQEASSLGAAQSYKAKFLVSIPQNLTDLEQFGVFVRIGEQESVEKESAYIGKVNAPKAAVTKGSTYNPPRGSSEDKESITNSEAKWAIGVWDMDPGIYEAEFEINIKESSSSLARIPLFYRAFAITKSGKVLRDPLDSELGQAEENQAKHPLYAQSYEKVFFEGGVEECNEQFCFSERLLDKKEGVYLTKPYNTRIFGQYELEFSITNNTQAVHNSGNFTIKNAPTPANQKIAIKSYSISNANSQNFSSSEQVFEIPPIALGDFRENKTIIGKMTLSAQEIGDSFIEMRIISDRQQVFEGQIALRAVNEADLNVSVLPKTLPALTEFDLNVSARLLNASDDFEEAEGAIVRVERTTPDRRKSVFTSTANGEGNAKIRLPSSDPGTKIKIRVEKEGYASKTINLEVSKYIVEFSPARLKFSLDLTTNTEQKIQLAAKNLVPISITLEDLRIRGNFSGLLDSSRMDNYLSQYEGKTTIEYEQSAALSVLGAISQNATQIFEQKKFSATLLAEFGAQNKKWALEVPIDITLSLSEPPKEPNCLEISIKEWKDATLGSKAQTEFTVKNNCITAAAKPLGLKNLKARMNWDSSKFGNVELQLTNPKSGQRASEVLSAGVFSTLFEGVEPEAEYLGLLVFTPKGDSIGKKAKFSVIIDAAQNTSEGEQLVGASNQIVSEIDIIDLQECIKYTPDPEAGVVVEEGVDDAILNIDSSACGNVEIDFSLCRGDKDCAGGVEGGIELSSDEFSLNSQSPKKSIVVSRQQIPGLYGIGVNVRTPGSNYREILQIDALIKPESEDAFSLRKYEFSLKGGSQDSTEVTNRFLSEQIGVDASVCDWGEATEKGWWDWKGAGVGAVVGGLMGIKPAMQAANLAAKSAAQGAGSARNSAKGAATAVQGASNASASTLQTVCSNIDSAFSAITAAKASCSNAPNTMPFVETAFGNISAAQSKCKTLMGTATAAKTDSAQALDSYSHFNALNQAPVQTLSSAQNEPTYIFLESKNYKTPAMQGLKPQKPSTEKYLLEENEAYFDGSSYVVPAVVGIGAAAIIIPKIIAHYSAKQASMQAIIGELDLASTAIANGQATLPSDITATQGAASSCQGPLSNSFSTTQTASNAAKSYSASDLATGSAKVAASQGANSAASAAATGAGSAITPAVSSASSFFTPGMIMGAYTLGGFFIGGIYSGLYGADPCSMRHSANLPDYVINLLEDATIESGDQKLAVQFDKDSAKVIGQYSQQRMGIVLTNNGISDPKPTFSTITINATQHLHSNPTKISKGTSFGPFNVPDRQRQKLESKIHVKIKTQEPQESLPDLSFDTLSCVSENKTGRSGSGAVPKVLIEWGFGSIDSTTCLEQNPNGVYCDATQFSIMLSKRINSLREFFDKNPNLKCPQNPFTSDFNAITNDLNVSQVGAVGCYIDNWSDYIDGEPAIVKLIEANKGTIFWTAQIKDVASFRETVHFNALLMHDGFSRDFSSDFASYYSEQRFFDTPDWFYGFAKDSSSKPYGVGRLFENGAIKFTNRFFDSDKLPSAGVYEVLVGIDPASGKFNFFNSNGSVNANVKVQFYLLREPNPNSVFYSMPLDGLVGIDGDAFSRQGYGSGFSNEQSSEFVVISNESEPLKSYESAASNPIARVRSDVQKGFYELNASASSRGNLLSVERDNLGQVLLVLSPSRATPLVLKVDATQISKDPLSAFYSLSVNESPLDVGSTLTYWEGAGACLDPSGTIITESFDGLADRSAVSADPVLNWQSSYAVDFGPVNYTGNAYLRTIFYTSPQEQVSIGSEYPAEKMEFLTADERGKKVPLAGVGGMIYNNSAGGSLGSVNSIKDIFDLVENGQVCVVDSGREASFFWNPKAIYEAQGKQSNIS